MIAKVLKEPLFHFLFAGFVLFVLFDWFSPKSYTSDESTIVVNQDALLTLLQYRSKAFNEDYFGSKLESMEATELDQLINEYVEEEVLYREAQRMNLADNDYIIKRRMIQKVDFIYQNQIESMEGYPEDSLRRFYEAHVENYSTPELYTFSHIYFKKEKNDFNVALQKAENFKSQTNFQKIDFNNSLVYGERFLYYRHYVEKDRSFITSQFGREFADSIAASESNNSKWIGPLKSDHGYHYVLLIQKQLSSVPDFEQIRNRIIEDYKIKEEKRRKSELIKSVIDRYKVILDL
jgi:parvulin-like peptidyl-prolyl isomerase